MKFEEIVKDLSKTIKTADAKSTTPYDSVATVTRVDGDTAWVHIAGGVDETPVKLTIDCKQGDEVQVRVGGGRAWIVGNATAPPTDDTRAIEAKKTAEIANSTAGTAYDIANATGQHFWTDDNGVHVASQSKNSTAERNTLWNSLGMLFRKGSNVLLGILTGENPSVAIYDGQGNSNENIVAQFGETVTIGKNATDNTRTVVSASSMDIIKKTDTNTETVMAHIGYGAGNDAEETVSNSPYYTFGKRHSTIRPYNDTYNFMEGDSVEYNGVYYMCYKATGGGVPPTNTSYWKRLIGNWSIVGGVLGDASGFASHAQGMGNCAIGDYSFVGGNNSLATGNNSFVYGDHLHAYGDNQTVIGRWNHWSHNNDDYAFVIGAGDVYHSVDAFTVDWNGTVTANGYKFSLQDVVSNSITLTSGSTTWQTLDAPSGSSYAVYAGYYINGSTNVMPYCVRQTDTGVQFALHNMVNSSQTFKIEARFLVWG